MLKIGTLHHVSLPVSNIEVAREFYRDVLGLEEDPGRPDFPFKGAWFKLGDRTLHLIVPTPGEHPTYRTDKAIDSHDAHFAIRVPRFSDAIAYLESKGFRRTADRHPVPTAADPRPMRVNEAGRAGFPQIYILDPDRNVIEINAERED
jgi:catechol 2,3-dioxygenase-like lactoylglutathione lyase family enzyme